MKKERTPHSLGLWKNSFWLQSRYLVTGQRCPLVAVTRRRRWEFHKDGALGPCHGMAGVAPGAAQSFTTTTKGADTTSPSQLKLHLLPDQAQCYCLPAKIDNWKWFSWIPIGLHWYGRNHAPHPAFDGCRQCGRHQHRHQHLWWGGGCCEGRGELRGKKHYKHSAEQQQQQFKGGGGGLQWEKGLDW